MNFLSEVNKLPVAHFGHKEVNPSIAAARLDHFSAVLVYLASLILTLATGLLPCYQIFDYI